jgi:hypothetical protein
LKSDNQKVAAKKKQKRTKVQANLVAHLENVAHPTILVANLLPSLSAPGYVPPDVQQIPPPVILDGQRRRNVSSLIVGVLPPHKRLNMEEKDVGDYVIVAYFPFGAQDDDEIEFHLGVIVEILPELSSTGYTRLRMHWWNTTDGEFSGVFKRGWMRNGSPYWGARRHRSHPAYEEVFADDGKILAHGNLLQGEFKLRRKWLKLLCSTAACKFKLKGHDEDCECM